LQKIYREEVTVNDPSPVGLVGGWSQAIE